MAKRKNHGQIRWEATWEQPPTTGNYATCWHVLVINEQREITRIRQKICEEMQPVEDMVVLTHGKMQDTSLRYEPLSLYSYGKTPQNVDWSKIYGGKVQRDRNLQSRMNPDGLANFVDESLTREKFR